MSAADAERRERELVVADAEFVRRGEREPRARATDGVSERDRAAVSVELRGIDLAERLRASEVLARERGARARFLAGEDLRGERFVDLDRTHLRERESGVVQSFRARVHGPETHARGITARPSPAAQTRERHEAEFLRARFRRDDERTRRVDDVAKILGLESMLDRKPGQLSGGQRQRVAMGRAMVREPQAFLMDEPLSNLDAKLRVTMRAELARLHERLGITTVYVTHDQVEAMTLGQRVAVLRDGILQQVDTPQNLFHHPGNLFVAAFIGSPSMNLVDAQIHATTLRFANHTLTLPPDSPLANLDRDVILGIRPSDFRHSDQAAPELPRIPITASVVEELGAETNVIFPIDAPRVQTDAVKAAADHHDDDDTLIADDQRALFTARLDGRHHIRPTDQLTLAIDTTHLHAFDPASGAVLADTRVAAGAGA